MRTRKNGGFHPKWRKYKNAPAVRAASDAWAELYSEASRYGLNERRKKALAEAEAAIAEAVEKEIAKTTRKNPTLVTFSNPSKSGRAGMLSKRAYEVRYKHIEDGHAYKHEFGPGVCIELLRDGSVRLFHKDGKSLWGDF